MLSIASNLLYGVTNAVVDWEGPSKTAFQRDLQRLIHDLEEADKCITLAVIAEVALVAAA